MTNSFVGSMMEIYSDIKASDSFVDGDWVARYALGMVKTIAENMDDPVRVLAEIHKLTNDELEGV